MANTITIKYINGRVLFGHTQDNNTIKATVEAAVKEGVSLYHADLRYADLSGTDLYAANLGGANLSNANLSGADLCCADLCCADLSNADLKQANLNHANLCGANLYYADLCNASLCKTNLVGVNLFGADIEGANLDDWGDVVDNGFLTIGPMGSRDDNTMFWHTVNGIFVMCGCFRGSLDEFAARVKETHKDNIHAQNYLAAIEFVKGKFERDDD